MKCFHCSAEIGNNVRWVMVMGERVPFHQPTATNDCVNDHLKRKEHPQHEEVSLGKALGTISHL